MDTNKHGWSDLATATQRAANATFFESHVTDKATQLTFGLELAPVAAYETEEVFEYVCGFIDRLECNVRQKPGQRLGQA